MTPEEILSAIQAYVNGPIATLNQMLQNNDLTPEQAQPILIELQGAETDTNQVVNLLIAVV